MTTHLHHCVTSPQHRSTKRVMAANSHGGCGRSTLATNLSVNTALLDDDTEGASSHWLKHRSDEVPFIAGIDAYQRQNTAMTGNWLLRFPQYIQRILVDTSTELQSAELEQMNTDAVPTIVPTPPSPIDIDYTSRLIDTILLNDAFFQPEQGLLALANRVKNSTRSLDKLDMFLNSLKLPKTSNIRDTQNYVHCLEFGSSIVDFPSARTKRDQLEWNQLVDWTDQRCA